jgi:hypothetical protein
MDPAWVAVLGTAVGAAGATAAAAISGWSARRQANAQSISQQTQWQREKRRDTYGAFLDAGVQARDELAAIWRSLNKRDPDLAAVAARLDAARELITGVKRASATNFVEGPELILEPTRRAEETIVLFHTLLQVTAQEMTEGAGDTRQLMCNRQEAAVREILDRFAAAAREVLNGTKEEPALLDTAGLPNADDELAWLRTVLAERTGLGADEIDVRRPLFELGLDSLGCLEVLNLAAARGSLERSHIWPVSSLLFTVSIEEVAGYLATIRAGTEPVHGTAS